MTDQIYWMDSSVLIEAKDTLYPKEIWPQFWQWLAPKINEGVVRMPSVGWDELTEDGNDWLSTWCKNRKDTGLNTFPNEAVEREYRRICDEVMKKWDHVQHQAWKSLAGCDLWLPAFAKVKGGIVVTCETASTKTDSNRVKIPNVCHDIAGVRCVTVQRMLIEAGAKFGDGEVK